MALQPTRTTDPMQCTLLWLDTCYPEARTRANMKRMVQQAMISLRDDLLKAYDRGAIDNSIVLMFSDFHTSKTEKMYHWTARLFRLDGFYLGGVHLFHPLNPKLQPDYQDREFDSMGSIWVREGLEHYRGRLRFLDGKRSRERWIQLLTKSESEADVADDEGN